MSIYRDFPLKKMKNTDVWLQNLFAPEKNETSSFFWASINFEMIPKCSALNSMYFENLGGIS
jgi:hypothetical protein